MLACKNSITFLSLTFPVNITWDASCFFIFSFPFPISIPFLTTNFFYTTSGSSSCFRISFSYYNFKWFGFDKMQKSIVSLMNTTVFYLLIIGAKWVSMLEIYRVSFFSKEGTINIYSWDSEISLVVTLNKVSFWALIYLSYFLFSLKNLVAVGTIYVWVIPHISFS